MLLEEGLAHPDVSTVRDGYDRIAAEYDERLLPTNVVEKMFIDTERDFVLAGIGQGTRVLDLGCGTGRLSVQAARLGAVTTGVDISTGMLRMAEENAVGASVDVELRQADVTDLPFPSGSFDYVISTLALTHISPGERPFAFREAARVLRPGGRLAVSVKNLKTELAFRNDRFVTVDRVDTHRHQIVFTDNQQGDEFAVPWHSFEPCELKGVIADAGLRLEVLRGNIPFATWIADAAFEHNPELVALVQMLERLLGDVPPFNHLGWYLLARAIKPAASGGAIQG